MWRTWLTQKNLSRGAVCSLSRRCRFGLTPLEANWKSQCNSDAKLKQTSFKRNGEPLLSASVSCYFKSQFQSDWPGFRESERPEMMEDSRVLWLWVWQHNDAPCCLTITTPTPSATHLPSHTHHHHIPHTLQLQTPAWLLRGPPGVGSDLRAAHALDVDPL